MMDFPGHFQNIFHQLNHQRLHGNQLCDCRVQVAGCSFQAHSSILAACSSHFKALLSSMEPGGQHGGVNLTLDCEVVTPEAFSTLLDMIYTSTLSLRSSNVMDVLLAASHLHLTAVVRACKLYLSKRNFPTSPPKGWRSSAAAEQQSGPLHRKVVVQHVDLSLEEEPLLHDPDGVEMEVSQSGGGGAGVKRDSCVQEERPGSRKRRRRTSGEENQRDASPTVTGSRGAEEEEELLLPLLAGEEDEEEVEEKYELPSQSHSSVQDEGGGDGDSTVVKVKVGEEEGGVMVEVKKENLSSSSPDHPPPPLSPAGGHSEHLDALNHEKLTAGDDLSTSSLQPCVDEAQPAGGSDESMDGEALDSLSELAFSCFLNPPAGSCDGIMESLEAEQSLARLTAAAVNAATESLAHFTANANEGLAHLNANEGLAHLTANANEGLAHLNANTSEGLAHLNANANEGLAHLNANTSEGLAHLSANADESLVHLNVNEGLAHLTTNEGLAHLNANANEGLVHLNVNEGLAYLNANEGLSHVNAALSTTMATADGTAGEPTLNAEPTLNPEPTDAFNTSSNDSSSSAVFPVASVPFQQILSSQGCGFSDTLILHPTHTSMGAGFLGDFLVPPPPPAAAGVSGSGRGPAAFRRIAPKATPASEAAADPDPSSSSDGVGARPVLTRASDDVLSKCKKAATEDNVLLVEGEKKYACRLCCKTFMNLTDCKKHIRVHTGEKPYPCPTCGKRFSQSSHLYKHSKNTCLTWKGGLPDPLL